jgi:hypothetical protein
VPGVRIYTAKVTVPVWESGDNSGELTTGILIRPGARDNEAADVSREFGLNVGYRQYFLENAQVELALYPSYAMEEGNAVTGEDYQGFALTTEVYGGYRFDIDSEAPVTFYALPQVGVGYTVFSDLGPSEEEERPSPTVNLQLGGRF